MRDLVIYTMSSRAVVMALLLCLHALSQGTASSSTTALDSSGTASSSPTALDSSGSLAQTLVMLPGTKWTRCFSDGRMNIIFSVSADAAGTVYSGLALPAQAQKCSASKPWSCKWLLSCDGAASCKRFFPGEMSGREKCLVLLNSAETEQQVELSVQLQSPGSWGAIIFGVVATSCGLLGVMAAGCYSDVSALMANSRQKKQKQQQAAAGSRRSSKAGQPGTPIAVVQQVLGIGQQGTAGATSLHQH